MAKNTENTAPVSDDVAIIDEETTQLVNFDLEADMAKFNSGQLQIVTSIKGDDFGAKLDVLSAMTSSVPVADNLDKTIVLADYLVHPVEMVDEKTGTLQAVPRVILIDIEGKAFHAISAAIYQRVKTMAMATADKDGATHWASSGGIPVQVSHDKGNNGFKYYNLKVVKSA